MARSHIKSSTKSLYDPLVIADLTDCDAIWWVQSKYYCTTQWRWRHFVSLPVRSLPLGWQEDDLKSQRCCTTKMVSHEHPSYHLTFHGDKLFSLSSSCRLSRDSVLSCDNHRTILFRRTTTSTIWSRDCPSALRRFYTDDLTRVVGSSYNPESQEKIALMDTKHNMVTVLSQARA